MSQQKRKPKVKKYDSKTIKKEHLGDKCMTLNQGKGKEAECMGCQM